MKFILTRNIKTTPLLIILIFLAEIKKIEKIKRYYVTKKTVYNVSLKNIKKALKIKTPFINAEIKS